MGTIGTFFRKIGRYFIRQVAAILLGLIVLVGTILGATIAALLVAIVGVVLALIIMAAPLLGSSATSMAESLKEKAFNASENVHEFKKPEG